jgi:hypothetical protein
MEGPGQGRRGAAMSDTQRRARPEARAAGRGRSKRHIAGGPDLWRAVAARYAAASRTRGERRQGGAAASNARRWGGPRASSGGAGPRRAARGGGAGPGERRPQHMAAGQARG